MAAGVKVSESGAHGSSYEEILAAIELLIDVGGNWLIEELQAGYLLNCSGGCGTGCEMTKVVNLWAVEDIAFLSCSF